MLIRFSVGNFLSFNEKQTFSMCAGKIRKFSERIYEDKQAKLTKCKAIFGANASGKSNLIEAFSFMQQIVINKFISPYDNGAFRQKTSSEGSPSEFEVELLIGTKRIVYGISILLMCGTIQREYMYELASNDSKRWIFERCTINKKFVAGKYFKDHDAKERMRVYGEDSLYNPEDSFLYTIGNRNNNLYADISEFEIFKKVYSWFRYDLIVENPDSVIRKFFRSGRKLHFDEIGGLLNAFGTGINNISENIVSLDTVMDRIPEDLYRRVTAELEKEQLETGYAVATIHYHDELYIFEMNDMELEVSSIRFRHKNNWDYFDFNEESKGTKCLLDLTKVSKNSPSSTGGR